jgi:hypothetical protein
MAEVTNELMYEALESIQQVVHGLKDGVREVKREFSSLRGHALSIQHDVHNICGILGRHDDRLERIENHLDLRELAETQKPYESQ